MAAAEAAAASGEELAKVEESLDLAARTGCKGIEIAAGGQVKGDTTTLEDFSVVAALQSEE